VASLDGAVSMSRSSAVLGVILLVPELYAKEESETVLRSSMQPSQVDDSAAPLEPVLVETALNALYALTSVHQHIVEVIEHGRCRGRTRAGRIRVRILGHIGVEAILVMESPDRVQV
jgi:hypothetical protein